MRCALSFLWISLFTLLTFIQPSRAQNDIPLPEHPNPIKVRTDWINLNGEWDFQFDPNDNGVANNWETDARPWPHKIMVPFPWGSELSGLDDEAEIGWYRRDIEIPLNWEEGRAFLVIGASDYKTTVWLDGHELGTHEGGYTPFEFEISEYLMHNTEHHLAIRVDDVERPYTLEGKQGYGDARGIWQTPYLERRGGQFVETVHVTPKISEESANVKVALDGAADHEQQLVMLLDTPDGMRTFTQTVPSGTTEYTFDIAIENPRLWDLDDPYLYDFSLQLGTGPQSDELHSYFGMREISVMDLPGTDYPYVALNGEPVYLELALDQAYHPEGFYTFPDDDFVRDEILRSRSIGLNGMRVHIKVPLPRKLYWADRLGMLIMEDLPNSWGQPDADAQRESEYTLREMIKRDYNHPSIFSWIVFNETWGLFTDNPDGDGRKYLQETKDWVVEMVDIAKSLDATRLVEDNSVCCGIGHTETEINSWHAYLPGWEWEEHLKQISDHTYEGSTWNFEDGYKQARQPNINSEFGNVWGYEGSTGDVDWSWDYHKAVNAFHRYPKIAGWLYTEHHDVINEWNGYWAFDRSEKYTGMDELVPGMSLLDLHAPFYLSPMRELCETVEAGSSQTVPLFATFLSGRDDLGDELSLKWGFYGWDALGEREDYDRGETTLPYTPWKTGKITDLNVDMPDEPSVSVLYWILESAAGEILHRNFITFVVEGDTPETMELANGKNSNLITFAPGSFSGQEWSVKQWDILDGKKVNGAGSGYFEYSIPWNTEMTGSDFSSASLLMELSSKPLLGKDRDDLEKDDSDYMRGGGLNDPSQNRNAYPMTNEYKNPSQVRVSFNGVQTRSVDLEDDPADHRGILSWNSQLKDKYLREAGTYGYKIAVGIPPEALLAAQEQGELRIRLEVPESLPGGVAIYGKDFGRFPMDPTIILIK